VAKSQKKMTYLITIGKYQLAVSLNRKRGRAKETPIGHAYDFLVYLVEVGTSNRFAGQPISRVLRRVFEKSQIRKLFGFHLAVTALIAGMVIPPISAFNPDQPDQPNTIMTTEDSLTTEKSVRVPVDSFEVSQGYSALHRGIDLNEVEGAPVYPLMEGAVERVFYSRFSYGNHILINHGSGFKSLYAHLAKIVVKEGDEVDKNTVIGTVGHTGWATGSHLHLEVYDNGRTFNPLTILK
jgi:hypothetical protein